MQELEDLGFTIEKSYNHDHFVTQRRRKGNITVETTWTNKGEFDSQFLWIEEVELETFTLHELNVLDLILNKDLVY